MVKMVSLQLGQAGYQVTSAANGFQGLKMARTDSPDLILLDLMLPGIDGFEVLNQLRADPQTADMPVVIISAKSGQADVETANRIGADGYLVKPFRSAELQAVLRSVLSDREEEAAPLGTGVAFTGARGGEAAPIALGTGLALASRGESTMLVDFRPFSVEHALLLGASPREAPIPLIDADTVRDLNQLAFQHPGGLRLLNNLEGTGGGGQLAPGDVQAVFDTVLVEADLVLADVSVYPAAVLHRVAACCARVLLVTPGDEVSLGAARSALVMMERVGMDIEQVALVLTDSQGGGAGAAGLSYPVVARVPAGAQFNDPAFLALAEWLLSLK
jgi:CheY-like chemotaxis protein